MKNLFKNTLGIFVILLVSIGQVFSQEIVVSKIPPPDGKSFARVAGIAQDSNGFMWFATNSGLYKYDGYQFTVYKNNPLDPNSLTNDSVVSLAIDLTGQIWVGTQKGLDRFNPITGEFKHYKHDPENAGSIDADWISSLLVDKEGTLWAGAKGLNRYDEQNDSFIHFLNIPGDSTSLSYHRGLTLYEDKNGIIWVGTGSVWDKGDDYKYKGGLNRMNKKNGTFTRYLHNPNNPNSLIDNKVTAIFEDSYGTFWVGTAGDGLHTMDREKGTFTRHTYDPKNPEKLSRPPLTNDRARQLEHIRFINEDANGAIWIGTFQSGLIYYDPKTKKIMTDKDFKGDNIDYMPRSVFSSREGVLWIGSALGDIYRIDPFLRQFPHNITSSKHVNSFYEEPNGTLWILTERELIRNDKAKGIVTRNIIDENPSIAIIYTVKIIKEDRQGNIWIGTKDGLFQWDKSKESLVKYQINPGGKYSSGNTVLSIYEDRKANLWIGKLRGLSLLNRKTGAVTDFLIYPNDTAEYGKNAISSILEDKTGKLWIGTWSEGGIYQFNPETGKFKNLLNGKNVSSIFEDSNGVLWVGCHDNLYKYDRSTENFIPYTDPYSSSGITNTISIVEDNQNYLWFSTLNSIMRLNPQRNAIVIYNENDGIVNDLVYKSVYKGRNGDLYFGDETGYFSFDPKEFTKDYVPPNIVFTEFLLADKPVKFENGGPLKESILQAKEITLNYNQNVFSFEFAALDFLNPEETKYQCRLENYDTDWRKVNSERMAYYFNVPPGKYTFRVNAFTDNGAWAEKKIDVIILPPWWKTWWAYGIYGLLFIALVFGIDRFQRQRLLNAEKKRTHERELAHAKEIEKAYNELGKAHENLKSTQSQLIQSEKMASLGELTAGIAHEIQNPLNFVNNFSEVNSELIDEADEENEKGNSAEVKTILKDLKENENKISHHGKRAESIVKGMLLHSRGSSGKKEPTDINALCDEYLRLAYHGFRAKDKSFNADFKTEFDESLPKIEVIPQDIGRVLLNLINNAFYAAPLPPEGRYKDPNYIHKPMVIVKTSFIPPSGGVRGAVVVAVSDNGPGIPFSIKDKIFQPFFTTKPTGQGTGLGLSLSYDIVKAHGGELKVETREGKGTEFIIQIPLK